MQDQIRKKIGRANSNPSSSRPINANTAKAIVNSEIGRRGLKSDYNQILLSISDPGSGLSYGSPNPIVS